MLTIAWVLFSSIVYISAVENDSSSESDERQTMSYINEMLSAEAYYNAGLKGELVCTKKESFLFSSLEQIGRKPAGATKGGLYKDANGGVWIVKAGQNSINEYLGSRLMNLFIGPLSPQVELLADKLGYTASKLLPDFYTQKEAWTYFYHKPIVGLTKLAIAMDLIGLGDRKSDNQGYINMGDKLEAARVDFDESFIFDQNPIRSKYSDINALESIVNIPDEMIFYVLGDAYNDL
ncbi:hypothetical protein AYO37_00690 [Opitutia bacterium SCGC AG-212-L18]|nr:hypothetical protein AYO37_00690 [Opitutae bacterium SCGC AG-212-L18]